MKKILLFALLLLFAFALPDREVRSQGQPDKGPLSKITFIHYRKGYKPADLPTPQVGEAKPPWAGGGNGNGGGTSSCYTLLSKGARWKTQENYVINTSNADGMQENFVFDTATISAEKWDTASGYSVFNNPSIDNSASFDFDSTDGVNVLLFDNYPDAGVIAVTNVWGYFYGNPNTRELVEWDMLFNESFEWGDATVDSTLMDLENIATHELGHAAGLGDLYDTACSTMTMYGYSTEGETDKRSLEDGDINGMLDLY